MRALTEFAGILNEILDATDRMQRQKGIEREANALEHYIDDLIAHDREIR